jgi:hypothetical protein
MVYFQTKKTNLGEFWRALEWNILVYFITIWYILWQFGIHTLWSFVNVVIIWYIFQHFGILCEGKSGNHADEWHSLYLL